LPRAGGIRPVLSSARHSIALDTRFPATALSAFFFLCLQNFANRGILTFENGEVAIISPL
jgi:hypothetical protein